MTKSTKTDKKIKFYGEKNRAAWNAVTGSHRKGEEQEHLKMLKKKDGTCLTEIDQRYFALIGVEGKRIAHVACNKGNELLSLIKLGASEDSVGFDISDEAIAYAKDLSTQSGIACQFERIDLYEIDEDDYGEQFHIVYLSVGALGWFHDINQAFKKMAALLKPNGHLFVHEMHPILDMFKPDNECSDNEKLELKFEDSYFRTEPFRSKGGLDYVSDEKYEACEEIWHHHKLSDIIQASINAGLSLKQIEELPKHISRTHDRLANVEIKPPMSFVMLCVK